MDAKEVLKQINGRLKGNYLTLASDVPDIKRVSTGLMSMDGELLGGLPMGVPILLSGTKSSCKSAFCFHMAGRAINEYGGVPLLFSSEPGFVPQWAEKCGLPLKDCIFFQAEKLTTTLQLFLDIVRNEKPTVIIVDSLTALSGDPDASLLDSVSRGERAKPTNEFFRKLGPALDKENPPLILIVEHLHANLTSPHGGMMTTGGITKDYMAVVELRFRIESLLKEEIEVAAGKADRPVQANVIWELKKNKVAAVGGTGTFSLGLRDTEFCRAGQIDDFNELLAKAIMMKAIKKSGSWFVVGDDKYQGITNLKAAVGCDVIRQIITAAGERSGEEECETDGAEAAAGVGKPARKARGRGKSRKGSSAVSGGDEAHDEGKPVPPCNVVEEDQDGSSTDVEIAVDAVDNSG